MGASNNPKKRGLPGVVHNAGIIAFLSTNFQKKIQIYRRGRQKNVPNVGRQYTFFHLLPYLFPSSPYLLWMAWTILTRHVLWVEAAAPGFLVQLTYPPPPGQSPNWGCLAAMEGILRTKLHSTKLDCGCTQSL